MLETGKYDLLVSRYYLKLVNLKDGISDYYTTRGFKLDILMLDILT